MPRTVNDELVEEIVLRSTKNAEFNSGIITADRYLRTLSECIGSDACYKFASSKSTSFADQVKRASSTLTYNNPEMVVEDQIALSDFDVEDVYGDKLELPKNCLMVFRHTLTSPKKDRDGDILRTQGARPDPKMLMLFQHTHTLPIGKMLGIFSHTKNRLSVYSAIVDMNQLSHDSAVMIDNKMGRFSHGFRALDFEKNKEDHSNGKTSSPGGFDIKSFEIMEESLVSVPSNTDAEVEEVLLSLVESKKLTSPIMKGYGSSIRSKRPLSLNVPYKFPIDIELSINGKAVAATTINTEDEEEEEHAIETAKSIAGTKCGCGCNGAPGGCGKNKPASEKADDDADHEHDTDEKSTDDKEVGKCPKCGDNMVGGMCEKCGYGKTSEEKGVKAGRVISAKNMGNLSKACDNLKSIHDGELLLTKGGRDKCKEAQTLLEDVIKSASSGDVDMGGDIEQRTPEITVKDAMAIFLAKADSTAQKKMMDTLVMLKDIDTQDQRTKQFKSLSSALIEKCGGPGGTPGPCPVGNKPKPSGGGHHSQAALDSSNRANIHTMQNFGHSEVRRMSNVANDYAIKARDYAKAGDNKKASKAHLDAAQNHDKVITQHKIEMRTAPAGIKKRHEQAIAHHSAARDAHRTAMESIKN